MKRHLVAPTSTMSGWHQEGYEPGMQSRTAAWVVNGRYRIDGLLGEGGMARVFDAYDERLGRQVAVKILRAETEQLPGMRERFGQEARIAARLVHPHIVAVLDYGEEDSSSYLVMERLQGTTLRDEIMRGPLSQQRLMIVVSETLSALGAAHRRGVLHRDIKPSNILLQDDGHTKITDFGIAKSFDAGGQVLSTSTSDLTMTGIVLGTPGYLAPECRYGYPASVQSDLYAVGAVMLEAATARRVTTEGVRPDVLVPPFREIASRAMAPDPRDRFGSAESMLHALRTPPARAATVPQPVYSPTAPVPSRTQPMPTASRPVAPPANPPPPAPTGSPSARRFRPGRWLAFAIVAVAVAIVALFIALQQAGPPTTPAHAASSHSAARTASKQTTTTTQAPQDPEQAAINALATSIAGDGQPGDGALASSLSATAAEPAGADREAVAQQTLSLAQVLLDGGGITNAQYQDVVNVLTPTGATPPTVPAPTPTQPTGSAGGPGIGPGAGAGGHDHGHQGGFGDQG